MTLYGLPGDDGPDEFRCGGCGGAVGGSHDINPDGSCPICRCRDCESARADCTCINTHCPGCRFGGAILSHLNGRPQIRCPRCARRWVATEALAGQWACPRCGRLEYGDPGDWCAHCDHLTGDIDGPDMEEVPCDHE